MSITRETLRAAIESMLSISSALDLSLRDVVIDFPDEYGTTVGGALSPEAAERFRLRFAERLTNALADKLGLPTEGPRKLPPGIPPWREHRDTSPIAGAMIASGADDATAAAYFAAENAHMRRDLMRATEIRVDPLRFVVEDKP